MLGKTHGRKAQANALQHHFLHGSVAVSGKRRMKMKIAVHNKILLIIDVTLVWESKPFLQRRVCLRKMASYLLLYRLNPEAGK